MTSPEYWVLFAAVSVAVFIGPKVCAWLEDRADARDRRFWMRQPGATR